MHKMCVFQVIIIPLSSCSKFEMIWLICGSKSLSPLLSALSGIISTSDPQSNWSFKLSSSSNIASKTSAAEYLFLALLAILQLSRGCVSYPSSKLSLIVLIQHQEVLTSFAINPLYCKQKSWDPSHILTNTTRQKFGGPGAGLYKKDSGIGKTPAVGPAKWKG